MIKGLSFAGTGKENYEVQIQGYRSPLLYSSIFDQVKKIAI